MTRLLALALAGLFISTSFASAQTGDEKAIRQRLAGYADARTRRDAHAEALYYTEDGDFRSPAGPTVTGRTAIEKEFTVNNPNYRFELQVVSIRFVDPQVAV